MCSILDLVSSDNKENIGIGFIEGRVEGIEIEVLQPKNGRLRIGLTEKGIVERC